MEQHTLIGAKLDFSRWVEKNGDAYWTVELIYQSTDQLRSLAELSLDSPPVRYTQPFDGVWAKGKA